jgi:hypothetical protein
MAIDPNIALGFRGIEVPNQLAQYAQIQQIQGAQQANQLNELKMAEYERARREEEGIRNYLAGNVNPTAPETRAGLLKFGKTGLEYGKLLNEADKAQAELGKVKAEAATKQTELFRDRLANVKTPEQAAQWVQAQYADPILAPIVKQVPIEQAIAGIPTDPKQFDNWKNQNAMGMTKWAERNTMTAHEAAQLKVSQGQLKVAQDRLAAETATGVLSPDTVDFVAETYRQTGQLPPLGMGKAAVNMRQKILERAAELSMKPTGDGAVPLTAAQAAAEVKANKAETAGAAAGQRAVGTQIANTQVAASEANKMINVAKPYVDRVNPTDYPVLNAAGNFVARNTGDPNVVGLATALNGLVNTYARAINPKGVATVSDKNHAREIINAAMSKGQINEAFAVMGQEMDAALASGPETRAAMRPNKPAAAAAGTGVDLTNPLLKP